MSPAVNAFAPSPLVSAAALRSALAAGQAVCVLDTSFDLANPAAGEAAFAAGHVPGARYVHLDRDLSAAKTGRNGRHPLPARADFAARAAAWGIGPGTAVVVLDRSAAMFAARLWWMLRWIGHGRVWVLDGGWAAWQAAGGAVETGTGTAAGTAPAGSPARRPALPRATMPTVDAAALAAALGRVPLIDARAGERFRGEVEPLDPVAGHIPGALNRPFQANLDADGRFRPREALRAEFQRLAGRAAPHDVVHQCGSGVTACHNLLAMEHAGLVGSRLYPGSWSEWCADPARPVALG